MFFGTAQSSIAAMVYVITFLDAAFLVFPDADMCGDGEALMGYSPIGIIFTVRSTLPDLATGFWIVHAAGHDPIE